MSKAPAFSVSSRKTSKKPASGRISPMLPATGSMMRAATSPPRPAKKSRTASISLKGKRGRVSRVIARNAPAVRYAQGGAAAARLDEQPVGVAVVAALELDDHVPAREAARPGGWPTSSPRCPSSRTAATPWRGRLRSPVPPTRSQAPWARRNSCPEPPHPEWRAPRGGWAWPRINGPRRARSRCRRCRRRPGFCRLRPSRRKRACRQRPGTRGQGESTPPGMRFCASANNSSDLGRFTICIFQSGGSGALSSRSAYGPGRSSGPSPMSLRRDSHHRFQVSLP